MNDDTEFEPQEWSEGKFLDDLKEIEHYARGFIWLLKQDWSLTKKIQTQIPGHIAALDRLANRCREEINRFGLWRENDSDIEDICDELEEEADFIVDEISRVMSWALDSEELAACVDFAANMLACERYLSGADLDFLEAIISGGVFNTESLHEIALNHGQWFQL